LARQFLAHVVRARTAVGEELLPVIRRHDLRHSHATLLPAAGEPVEVVFERLGHATATITLWLRKGGLGAMADPGQRADMWR
jgi:integrase